MSSLNLIDMRKAIDDKKKEYSIIDDRIYLLKYDSTELYEKYGHVSADRKVMKEIPVLPISHLDLLRLCSTNKPNSEFQGRIMSFLKRVNELTGFSDFKENRERLPKYSYIEARWLDDIK